MEHRDPETPLIKRKGVLFEHFTRSVPHRSIPNSGSAHEDNIALSGYVLHPRLH